MKVTSATAVLLVDVVEETREFFKRAGFEVTMEVPDGDKVGFAIFVKDGVQVMAETKGNEREPKGIQMLTRESRCAVVFVEVDDLDAIVKALDGSQVVAPRHKTFYGSEEITYQEPGGNLVTFAKFNR